MFLIFYQFFSVVNRNIVLQMWKLKVMIFCYFSEMKNQLLSNLFF